MNHKGWIVYVPGQNRWHQVNHLGGLFLTGPVFQTREHLELAWPDHDVAEVTSPQPIEYVKPGQRHGHNSWIAGPEYSDELLEKNTALGYKIVRLSSL